MDPALDQMVAGISRLLADVIAKRILERTEDISLAPEDSEAASDTSEPGPEQGRPKEDAEEDYREDRKPA